MAIYVRDEKGVLQALDIPAYKGEKGEAGITPNLQVGDVVTLESGQQATIVRRGDDENPIFDFAIPKGDDGKDGIFVGRVDDAPDHAQVVVNDDASPYDLFFENANVSYMGDTYTSLKEKADADIEYLLRKIETQHYEGQRITATDTYQKQVRSAILKGQTLVNIFDNWASNVGTLIPKPTKDGYYIFTGNNKNARVDLDNLALFKRNVEYTFIFRVKNSTYDGINSNSLRLEVGGNTVYSHNMTNGIWKVKKLFTTDESNCFVKILSWANSTGNAEVSLQIIEGDYTNVDIPYFTGMSSVKMPVLKTTGKNLFDPYSPFDTDYYGSEGKCLSCHYDHEKKLIVTEGVSGQKNSQFPFLKFKPNTTYTFSGNVVGHQQRFCIHNESKQIEFNGTGHFSLTATTGDNGRLYVSILKVGTPNGVYGIENLQIKEGSTATSYEPHKSNILSTPKDVELGSVGNVKDELNLVTGELTQRTDIRAYQEGDESNSEVLTDMTNTRYKLPKEVIKTVDLNNQKVYSYDGTTHYTTSSGVEGHLAPILSIDVPTNLPALVSRQRDTIKDLEKENEALKEEVVVVNQQRESGDLELLSSDFDLDFRLMEIEFALDIPIAATFKEVRNMARTPYEMAKILILGGKYERSDMEYKLGKYLERKQITQAQYDELIALMEANELVV